MGHLGWAIVIAMLAPLLSRRLDWNWKPGGLPLLWGVILAAGAIALPKLAMLFTEGMPQSAMIVAVVIEAVAVILVFVGLTGFRPLEDA